MNYKVRLTQDCEHGEKGKILIVEDYRLSAFLAEGRVEAVQDDPVDAPTPEPEPAPQAPPKKKRK